MDFLPPASHLAILDGPRREGITGKRVRGKSRMISFDFLAPKGWPPHKLGARIPRVWGKQMQFLISKTAGNCGVREEI